MRNKRGLSQIITTILLLVAVLAIGAMIYYFSISFVSDSKKQTASTLAEMDCEKRFDFDISGCLKTTENKININIINLKDEIIPGTMLSLISKTEIRNIQLPYPGQIELGKGRSMEINLNDYNLDINTLDIEKIKLMPVFEHEGARVLCEGFQEVNIGEC